MIPLIPPSTISVGSTTASNSTFVGTSTGQATVTASPDWGNTQWGYMSNIVNFSKVTLDNVFEELKRGKYTRKYADVYLEFMFLNSFLNNLEYLEYKTKLEEIFK
jgi:nitrous oxidase accessory protein NosD